MAAPLTILLFGPMRVLIDGTPLQPLRSRKALWALALLTLRGGKPVAREWVAGMLWPDAEAGVALANLRPIVSELRRAMGGQGDRLQTPNRKVLALDLREAEVDVTAFEEALARGDLQAAIDLYQGPLLEDCPEEWVPQERDSREQDCLKALHTLSEAADPAVAIGYCRKSVEIAPWRDAPRRDLMEALARSGDINAALQAYRDFAYFLRGAAGGSPDAQTTALYTSLRSNAQAGENAPRSGGSAASAPRISGYLPHPLTQLVGREDERIDIREKLKRYRLVTLTGFGGMGKTRLAREVATDSVEEFPDGVWLVSLEAISDERLVLGKIASTLDVREEPGRSIGQSLTDRLQSKRLLLVLDNCEHLLGGVVEACERLLRDSGEIRILATSREALGLVGERVWQVPPLTTPEPASLPNQGTTRLRVAVGYEGIRLFVERVQAVREGFELDRGNVRAVAEICARLEGVPLAIELAAARAKTMPVEEIAERLRQAPLGLLIGSSRVAAARQQTLRATMEWSYGLLSRAERILLRRLAVFAGGWTLAAAEKIAGGSGIEPGWVLEGLGLLVDKSLVAFDASRPDPRYGMLETVRQFAHEKLLESGEMEDVATGHRKWFLLYAKKGAVELVGPEMGVWLRRLSIESGNLGIALERSQDEPLEGLELCYALTRFWRHRGLLDEAQRALTEALTRPGALAATPERANALNSAASFATSRVRFEDGRKFFQECLEIRSALGDRLGTAHCLNNLGILSMFEGKMLEAREEYEESFRLLQGLDQPLLTGLALCNLGILSFLTGDYAESRTKCEEALTIYRLSGAPHAVAFTLNSLANVSRVLGRYSEARAMLDEALDIFRDLEDRSALTTCLYNQGNLEYDLGRFEAAMRSHKESLEVCRELGDRLGGANASGGMAYAALGEGDPDAARRFIQESLSEFESLNHDAGIARASCALGEILLAQQEWRAARQALVRAVESQKRLGDRGGIVTSLRLLAEVSLSDGDPAQAVRLYGASEALRTALGMVLSAHVEERLRRSLAEIARSVPLSLFENAWQEGQAFDVEGVVADGTNLEFGIAPRSLSPTLPKDA